MLNNSSKKRVISIVLRLAPPSRTYSKDSPIPPSLAGFASCMGFEEKLRLPVGLDRIMHRDDKNGLTRQGGSPFALLKIPY